MKRIASGAWRLFEKRLRGFRVVDLAALACLVAVALGVYAFKAAAGAEGGKIKEVDQAIAEETRTLRLLRAEVAHLEAPDRLERLSTSYLGLKPEDARREAPAEALQDLVRRAPPQASRPTPPAQFTPTASTPAPTPPAPTPPR